MKILFFVLSFLLLIVLVLSPILLFKKLITPKYKFLKYIGLGILITALTLLIMGWWSSKSTELLLSLNGYNFDAMNEQERYENVANENIEAVKNLEISRNGIGWPAKVILIFPFFLVYLFVVYLIMSLCRKQKENQNK